MYSIKDIKEIWKSSLRVLAMKGSACYYILPNAVKKLRCSNQWKITGGIMITPHDTRHAQVLSGL